MKDWKGSVQVKKEAALSLIYSVKKVKCLIGALLVVELESQG